MVPVVLFYCLLNFIVFYRHSTDLGLDEVGHNEFLVGKIENSECYVGKVSFKFDSFFYKKSI